MAEENPGAPARAAGAFGRVRSGRQPERDPGVREAVGPLGQAGGKFRAGQGIPAWQEGC
ncbi:hypothetical protein GCM10010342_48060 [Streptomyces anulatus]|nr:hypothetical protein GCM10010342_48060 [Streptomyces anulatus]